MADFYLVPQGTARVLTSLKCERIGSRRQPSPEKSARGQGAA